MAEVIPVGFGGRSWRWSGHSHLSAQYADQLSLPPQRTMATQHSSEGQTMANLADNSMKVFEQFLTSRNRAKAEADTPYQVTLQFVEGTSSPASQRWQLLAYDTFGLLVRDSRDTYFFPWHAILRVS